MNNSKSIIPNLIWRFAERCGAQGVSFVVSIVLARMLAPELYGTVALVTVFTAILQVFVDSGMGNALIQKKDADDLDFSTVFYFNIFSCSCLYLIMFIAAPYIAAFYNDATLTPIVRILSLTLIISGVKNIQQAYVSRNMQFKRFFFATLGGTLISAAVGIAMAYLGFGVWALVAQRLTNSMIDTTILWFTVKWKPKLCFSLNRLKSLFSFGWKLLISALLDTVYTNLRALIIGKVYSSTDLAYYNKGKQMPYLLITNINNSIDSVLFPKMASEQDNPARIKEMTRKAIRTSSYFIWPAMIGLLVCAEPLILLLLTEKWLPAVPYLRLFCITYAFWPIHTANLNAIKAVGRSDLFLKLEIIKKCIGVASILLTVRHGVYVMAFAGMLTAPLSSFINASPNKNLINYSYFEQLKDLFQSIALSCTMGFCVWWLQYLQIHLILILMLQVLVGVAIYFGLSALFKAEPFLFAVNMLKPIVHKFKKKKA